MARIPIANRILLICCYLIFPSDCSIAGDSTPVTPAPLLILPFLILLLSIAVIPLISSKWWEKSYPAISIALGAFTAIYYIFILHNPVRITEIAREYISFIVFLGALFITTGGIHIHAGWTCSPSRNTLLLGIGALLANLVGTTGASMLLIRPYLQSNRERIRPYHIVFFIILIGNIGGALTPIGDPPLYLGYLKGIPFFWTLSSIGPAWFVAVALVLLIFLIIDSSQSRKVPPDQDVPHQINERPLRIEGWHNIIFLGMIVGSFFVGSSWIIRGTIMIVAAILSYLTTKSQIHRMNRFVLSPFREVILLFFGIFLTMIPALDWLSLNAGRFDLLSPGSYFWGTGILSSVLDNAPTYLGFFNAAIGTFVPADVISQHGATEWLLANHPLHLMAISTGAVFFGALTYIGNGPNFMIRSIAQHAGVETPTFSGYIIKYSLPILLPVFVVIWMVFF